MTLPGEHISGADLISQAQSSIPSQASNIIQPSQ